MIPRENLIRDKGSIYLIQMIYIEVFAYLRKNLESLEVLENKLREMGNRIGKSIYIYYKPRKFSLIKMLRDVIHVATGVKNFKIKTVKKSNKIEITIIYNQCPLCVSEVEEKGVHYCIPTMAILEEYLKLAINDGKLKGFKSVEGKVIKSVSSGDDHCEYFYKLIKSD